MSNTEFHNLSSETEDELRAQVSEYEEEKELLRSCPECGASEQAMRCVCGNVMAGHPMFANRRKRAIDPENYL